MYVSDARGTAVRRLSPTAIPPCAWQQFCKSVRVCILAALRGLWEMDLDSSADRAVQPTPARALGTKFITELKQTPDGAIWIATRQDGLYRYDLKTQALLNIKPNPNSKASLTHRNVSGMLFDSRGWLWVGMQGGGLDLPRPGTKPNGIRLHPFW